jgi:ParB-like chromosome segregation protein Spo0J
MQIIRISVANLRPHPLQDVIYGDLSPSEFAALKQDIQHHGIRQPVEVTKDGVLVDGKHRVRALRELGIAEVDAIIVEAENEEAIEERFVTANLLRRQSDPVTKARAIQQLAKIESRRIGIRIDLHAKGPFRDRLASLLGNTSGRTIDRYLQLLRLEREIQDAVSSGQLPMTKALKIESLPKPARKAIVERLKKNEPPGKVVEEFLRRPQLDEEILPEDRYRDLCQFFEESLDDLALHSQLIVGSADTKTPVPQLLARAEAFCAEMRHLELQVHSGSM